MLVYICIVSAILMVISTGILAQPRRVTPLDVIAIIILAISILVGKMALCIWVALSMEVGK